MSYQIAASCASRSGAYSGCAASGVFFSSRRRHTRLTCDWSSDVCSSDLDERSTGSQLALAKSCRCPSLPRTTSVSTRRSEERRVGKECRSRWLAYHYKKKRRRRRRRGSPLRNGPGRDRQYDSIRGHGLLQAAERDFFLSSRRRHTRLTCDWSSDVCSSD